MQKLLCFAVDSRHYCKHCAAVQNIAHVMPALDAAFLVWGALTSYHVTPQGICPLAQQVPYDRYMALTC